MFAVFNSDSTHEEIMSHSVDSHWSRYASDAACHLSQSSSNLLERCVGQRASRPPEMKNQWEASSPNGAAVTASVPMNWHDAFVWRAALLSRIARKGAFTEVRN